MKKRIIAFVVCMAMVFGLSAFGVYATDNLISSGKKGWFVRSVDSGVSDDRLVTYLTDDDLTKGDGWGIGNETNLSKYEYYWLVDLGAKYKISKVAASPVLNDGNWVGTRFPQQFKIEVSDSMDFSSCETFYETEGDYYENPNEYPYSGTAGQQVDFGPKEVQEFTSEDTVSGRYVRFYATKSPVRYNIKDASGQFYDGYVQPALAELRVYGQEAVAEDLKVSYTDAWYGWNGQTLTAVSDNKISDGNKSTNVGMNITDGTSKNSNTAQAFSVIVDLGEVTKISKAVITPVDTGSGWAGSRFPDQFELQVSDTKDGEYTTVFTSQEWVNPNEWYVETRTTAENYGPTEPVVCTFNAKGRFIRFLSKKLPSRYQATSGGYNAEGFIQPAIAEFEIYKPNSIMSVSTTFKSGDTEITEASEISGSVSAVATVNNLKAESTNGILIYALYNNGEMVNCETKVGPFSTGVALDAVTFSGLDSQKTYSFKVMLWDALTGLRPLATYSELR